MQLLIMQSPGDVEKGSAVDTSITCVPTAAQESSSHHPGSAVRLVTEFHTLGINVESRVNETGGRDEERRKRLVVKG